MPSSVSGPAAPATIRTPAGDLVYTDVGEGPTVVLLHGNPTSARLYRHLISGLRSDYRCVAPDYLGFGRSAAPPGFSYRPPAHATLIERLLQQLGCTDITLVLHDWGGPIGLSYALRHPNTVRALVLMNTWAWPLTHRPLVRLFARFVDTELGRHLIERHNLFARAVMPRTTGSTSSTDWIGPYAAALDTRVRRRACWHFARSLIAETPWLRALWTDRHRLPDVPTLLCWGMADPAFGTEQCLRRWHSLFPSAHVHREPTVGHYVPEEMGADLTPLIRTVCASAR